MMLFIAESQAPDSGIPESGSRRKNYGDESCGD
jgi:hypothetical protein